MYVKERTEAAAFAEAFAEGWAIGATDPERFFRHFAAHFQPNALLIQPLSPPARGEAGLRRSLGPVFDAMPDLTGEVLSWGETEDGLLIELRLTGTLSGLPVAWTTVDRITLRDGLLAERVANFDPLPLIWALVRRPRAAMRLAPSLIRRKDKR